MTQYTTTTEEIQLQKSREHFLKTIPRYPFASSTKEILCLYRIPKDICNDYCMIELNQKNKINRIALDCDKVNYTDYNWEQLGLCPNWTSYNRQPDAQGIVHSHLVFELVKPVHNNEFNQKNRKTVNYVNDIRKALALRFSADSSYTNKTVKNLNSDVWLHDTPRTKFYTLEELSKALQPELDIVWKQKKQKRKEYRRKSKLKEHERLNYLDLEQLKSEGKLTSISVGERNQVLFDNVRYKAYKLVNQDFKALEDFQKELGYIARDFNNMFPYPLSAIEVGNTVKSIANYCWRNKCRFGKKGNPNTYYFNDIAFQKNRKSEDIIGYEECILYSDKKGPVFGLKAIYTPNGEDENKDLRLSALGRKGKRTSSVTVEERVKNSLNQFKQLHNEGKKVKEICSIMEISLATGYVYLKQINKQPEVKNNYEIFTMLYISREQAQEKGLQYRTIEDVCKIINVSVATGKRYAKKMKEQAQNSI